MYTQFFGTYLLSGGYVTPEQLFSAMQRQTKEHIKLGTLAIHAGHMTADQVDKTVIEQTHQDRKFGELAIELGYLTEEQAIEQAGECQFSAIPITPVQPSAADSLLSVSG